MFNRLEPTSNFNVPQGLTLKNLHFYHMEFVCFVLFSEQTANFAVCNIKRLIFITLVESVYRAVRIESLYNTYGSSLNG